MSKVGIIGDKDSVMGFLALGIDIFPAYTAEEIKKKIHQLAERDYAIIYITEQLAELLSADIDRYKTSVTPAVILIPGKTGSLGLGARALQNAVERAVGADIG